MAKVILTKEAKLANRIIRCLPKQKVIADELGISQQLVSYRINHTYQKEISDFIKLLNLAGYEVVESENL